MGRNDESWSDRHRAAIGWAMKVEGMSSSDAVAAGKRGELGDLAAFDMPASTARDLARKWQQDGGLAPDLEMRAQKNYKRLQEWVDRRVNEILGGKEVREWDVRQILETQAKLERAVKLQAAQTRPPSPSSPKPDTEDKGLLSALQQKTNGTETEDEPGS